MSPLAGLTKLRSLDVSGTLMGDPTPLMSLTGLASLSLGPNYVEDLSFLVAFPNLRVFEMRIAFPLGLAPDEPLDFSPIANSTRLRNVSIEWFSSSVADLAPIAALPWVEHLRLPGIRLTDLSAIAAQLVAENHSLREFDVHWNWLDIRPGTANRELIDALEQSGTDVSFANQFPYSNPDFQSPSLTISRTGSTLITLSWIADPSLGVGTLESSTDLETWEPAGVSVDQPFDRSYWEAQIDLSSSGTAAISHFRVRQ
jgi:Leucine-rich repeat (LRR) protein